MRSENVAIFWDYENCSPASHLTGYKVVESIRSVIHDFGTNIKLFKAYLELSNPTVSSKSVAFRSELQSSGVSLTDCPHNGGKDVVDKMILVDILLYAMDNPAPSNIILISGDRDYAYAVSTLRNRGYTVVVIALEKIVHTSMKANASVFLDWNTEVLDATAIDDLYTGTSTTKLEERHRNRLYVQTPERREKLAANFRGPPSPFEDTITMHAYPSTPSQRGNTGYRAPMPKSVSPVKRGASPAAVQADDVFATPTVTGTRAQSWATIAVCDVFLRGRCKYGDTCRRVHPQSSQQQPAFETKSALEHDSDAGVDTKRSYVLSFMPQDPTPPNSPPSSNDPEAWSTSSFLPGLAQSPGRVPTLTSNRMGNGTEFAADEKEKVPTPERAFANIQDDITPAIEQSATQDRIEVSDAPGLSTATAMQSGTQSPLVIPTETLGLMVTPPIFQVLVRRLQFHQSKGSTRMLRSEFALDLISQDQDTYKRAGVQKFKQYIAMAESAGIIQLGGKCGAEWISLHPQWYDAKTSS